MAMGVMEARGPLGLGSILLDAAGACSDFSHSLEISWPHRVDIGLPNNVHLKRMGKTNQEGPLDEVVQLALRTVRIDTSPQVGFIQPVPN